MDNSDNTDFLMPKIHQAKFNDEATKKALRERYLKNPASLLVLEDKDCAEILAKSKNFYEEQLKASGTAGLVVGLSGGIDSAVVAYLAVNALGIEKVYGVLLPSQHTTKEHVEDGLQVAAELKIEVNNWRKAQSEFEALTAQLENLGEPALEPDLQKIKLANIHARLRMLILRDIARAKNFLVAGTGNASELLTGYFTIAGDGLGGVDNEVLGRLFKTQVIKLAEYLKIPERIIEKPPTAGLYHGQTDEEELGVSYEVLDLVLMGYLLGFQPREILQVVKAANLEQIEGVFERIKKNAYKLEVAPVMEIL